MSEPINWQELTPEQRDRIVAEKVMGWQEKPCEGSSLDIAPFAGGWECGLCGFEAQWEWGQKEGEFIAHTPPLPRYTTSLDAAWQVVEHITRPSTSIEEAERAASTRFTLWFEDATLWAMRREQVCEEICVEALRATGEQVIA